MAFKKDVEDMSRSELEEEVEELRSLLENAGMAMSETSPSWERRCHSIMAALGFDYGGPAEDMPEEGSYHSHAMRQLRADNDRLIDESYQNGLDAKRWRALVNSWQISAPESSGFKKDGGKLHRVSDEVAGLTITFGNDCNTEIDVGKRRAAVDLLTVYADFERVRNGNTKAR